MDKKISLMDTQKTYFFLWKKYMMGRRIIIPRYGDGEFLIMKGRKSSIATHIVTKELTDSLNNSIKKRGQLICMPTSMAQKGRGLRSKAANYFLETSGHSRFGTGNWRILDNQFNFNFLTEFFIGKTLVVTGNYNECKKAFKANNVNIDVLQGRKTNAFIDYEKLKRHLIRNSKNYKNIIFCLGPTSNILIADLIGSCKSNLIDIGGIFGFIINPYSVNEDLIKRWTGIPKRSNKETSKRISRRFFKTLTDKIKIYK